MISSASQIRTRGFAARALEHPLLLAVLALSVAVRAATTVAYHPALFYSDSWGYGLTARAHSVAGVFVPGFETVRPSGYPLFLDLLALVDRSAAVIAAVQHLIGLAAAIVVYLLCRRFGAPRALAAAATAVVALDAFAIALEHHVLSEALFGAVLLGGCALVAARPWGLRAAMLSGALLALAVTIRTSAAFAIPVWAAFLVATRPNWRAPAAAVAALLAPLLAYGAAHAAAGRGFGLTEASGWFMYGRTGELADCSRMTLSSPSDKALCAATEATPERDRNPLHYMWSAGSPAQRRFGDAVNLGPEAAQRSSGILRDFALQVIRARPGAYVGLVASDFVRFFVPGRMSPYGAEDDHPIILPERHRSRHFRAALAGPYFGVDAMPEVRPPAPALRSYADVIHTPRWLLGILVLAAIVAIGLARTRLGARMSRAPAVWLLMGSALAILLGSVLTASFNVRYLVPLVPLIVTGGVAAVLDLAAAARVQRAARA